MDLIFLRQTERKDESNWKIDTISVVQEQKIKIWILKFEIWIWFPKISTLDKSIILSYLINFFFTTKSLILAQDER